MRTLREALDIIDEVLCQGDQEAVGLWTVMTSLRGPDALNTGTDSEAHIKEQTTCMVRRTAFPKFAALGRDAFTGGTRIWPHDVSFYPYMGLFTESPADLLRREVHYEDAIVTRTAIDLASEKAGRHFADHVGEAARILNIIEPQEPYKSRISDE